MLHKDREGKKVNLKVPNDQAISDEMKGILDTVAAPEEIPAEKRTREGN